MEAEVVIEVKGMKTWSALAKNKRRPSEYEIVSTNMHYRNRRPDQAYELSPAPDLFMNKWYKEKVFESPLKHDDWDEFRDPDQMIYRVYTRMQDGQEDYVDGLLDEYDEIGHDAEMSDDWLASLKHLYTPGRYLINTLLMSSAYLLQVAPASTVSNCAAFQEGDCFRWLQRVAYRTRELQIHRPESGIGTGERNTWETYPAWQGYRELMEKLLCAYDWGEHLVALNVVAKPAVDEGFLRQLGVSARRNGDTLLALLLDNQLRDSDRHRRWIQSLLRMCQEKEGNAQVINDWVRKWVPLAEQAVEAYCSHLPDNEQAAIRANADAKAFRLSLGVEA
jgi:toluene monooxygenase system protein E